MDRNELVIGTLLDIWGHFARKRQFENFLTLFVSETDNHNKQLLKSAYSRKRKLLEFAFLNITWVSAGSSPD
jgi:hypothetical protein